MFPWSFRKEQFEREVRVELEFLRKLHGEDAARIAAEKAARPTNRTARRKVLREAARRLASEAAPAPGGFFGRFRGGR